MLFALRQPAVLLGLLLGFSVGCLLRTVVTRLILSGGYRRLRVVGGSSPLRGVTRPRAWLDPFGAVAATLCGIGWTVRQEPPRRSPGRLWAVAVGAVAAHAALAALGFAAFLALGGSRELLNLTSMVSVLHGGQLFTSVGQEVALGFAVENLGCGLLSIVPIPPLETGVAAWSTLPRTAGARRFSYRLLEEQWGVAALLVLVLLPLGDGQPALLALVATVGDRILAAI